MQINVIIVYTLHRNCYSALAWRVPHRLCFKCLVTSLGMTWETMKLWGDGAWPTEVVGLGQDFKCSNCPWIQSRSLCFLVWDHVDNYALHWCHHGYSHSRSWLPFQHNCSFSKTMIQITLYSLKWWDGHLHHKYSIKLGPACSQHNKPFALK